MDLAELFRFDVAPLELVIRGSAVYWFLYLLFRFVLRRDVGSLGIADVLLLVLIADASQNAMSGGYQTLSEGAVVVGTIALWNMLIDWLAYRFTVLRRLIEPPRLQLVRQGRLLIGNLNRQFMTVEELRSKLREHGIERIEDVRAAYMEPDGTITAIRKNVGAD